MALIARMDLQRITLVCQDWGGILGLTIPMEMPERFKRLIVMNTALTVGLSPGEGFMSWLAFSRTRPDYSVAGLFQRSVPGITAAEAAAYEAPFPDARYRAGARVFPAIVPITPEMPGAAISKQAARWWKTSWRGDSFMAIGLQDPVLGEQVMMGLHRLIPNCPPPLRLEDAGHFVQERGDVVARAALAHFNR